MLHFPIEFKNTNVAFPYRIQELERRIAMQVEPTVKSTFSYPQLQQETRGALRAAGITDMALRILQEDYSNILRPPVTDIPNETDFGVFVIEEQGKQKIAFRVNFLDEQGGGINFGVNDGFLGRQKQGRELTPSQLAVIKGIASRLAHLN